MPSPPRNLKIRPDPDALLAVAQDEKRGRLRVFLGAAPGVGKTFAMLQGARRKQAEGADVVIGLVETHGRAETAALLEGLEVLPRQSVEYRGRNLQEFNLEAALKRRPKLVILDELAHSNPETFRHPKRWQDATELLDAGIDVWTALNIQHLESLSDVVSRITGVTVRETVPDKVLQDADEVVLVDITPDELIARLKEGKIYVPETARRATQNFFTTANLTALRELALRRTAERVDDDVDDQRRAGLQDAGSASAERLLVCIERMEQGDELIRYAARLANSLNASWIVVYPTRLGKDDEDREKEQRIARLFQLSERLGAETTRLAASDVVAELMKLAEREGVTQFILFAGERRNWLSRAPLAHRLLIAGSVFAVHLVPLRPTTNSKFLDLRRWFNPHQLTIETCAAGLATSLAVIFGLGAQIWVVLPNMSLVFLAAVLLSAFRFGTRSAVIASILSFFAYNFFFIHPVYTFTIAEPHEIFALLVFLATAFVTGSLAGRVREQAVSAERRATATQTLYDFSKKLAAASKVEEVLFAAASQINIGLATRTLFLLPSQAGLRLTFSWPPEDQLDPADRTAAEWAFAKGEPAGWKTGTLPNLPVQYRPLRTPRAVIGVCGFSPSDPTQIVLVEGERTLTAILDQTAIALERAQLIEEAVRVAALKENEAIREAVLASLSHDLRTPLATIAGGVSSLRELGDRMSAEERRQILSSVEEETRRMSSFVTNLLNMSRIEAGALKARRDWVDVSEIIRSAAERARKAFPEQQTTTSVEPGLPLIRGDANLLEQVLFNLLDNAQKYGGDSKTTIHARRDGEQLLISVTDEGPGIKPSDLERVFEKFYRSGRSDGRRAGTGLGLSICRGIVQAMGGKVEAQSPAIRRRGTRIVIRLPMPQDV